MATYTPPYPPKVKESINVDFKDRWTAQKVKFINREKQGRYYVLTALINKDEYQNNFIDDIVKNVFEGCEAELMDKLLNRNSVELKN